MVLETTSLEVVTDCYASYLHCIVSLISAGQRHNGFMMAEHSEASYNLPAEDAQGTLCMSRQAEIGLPNTFALSLSHFAVVFVHENESGKLISSSSVTLHCSMEKVNQMFNLLIQVKSERF